jgi:hypothetical protein
MKTEISPMVTMLAERMRTNPEDFVYDEALSMVGSPNPKFYGIAQTIADMVADPNIKYYWFLNETEKQMLVDAYRELCRSRFEDDCMKKLLGDKQEHRGPALGPTIIRAQGRYQTTPWVDPRSLYGQREDLRVSASENNINTVQNLSFAQRINGALNKMVGK